jgi:hypothetical protein
MPIGSARGLVRRRSRASREWVQHDLRVSACQCSSGPAGEAAPAPSPRPSGRSSTSIRQRPRTCVPACWPPPIAAGTGRANPPHSWTSTASSAHRRTRNDASLRLPRAPPQLLGVRFALAPAVRLDQAMPGPVPPITRFRVVDASRRSILTEPSWRRAREGPPRAAPR